jgi:hypothetical protein
MCVCASNNRRLKYRNYETFVHENKDMEMISNYCSWSDNLLGAIIYTEFTISSILTTQQKTNHETGWSSDNTKICTHETVGFELGRDTDQVLCDFPQSLLVNVRIVSELGCSHFLPNPFQLVTSPDGTHSSILAESSNSQPAPAGLPAGEA